MDDNFQMESDTFKASLQRSREIELDIEINPYKYRILTGDRPTGNLHIGHLFGSLQNRVRFQDMGIETFIVIADYQVLTDRDSADDIANNVKELVIDYISSGINPDNNNTCIFPHSYIPELNQLLVPFLFLVGKSELDRNPTVKDEITAAGLSSINAGMYVYPVHQAADILSVQGNLVPVGKDQLPHLELCRQIARRFNKRFGQTKKIFKEPEPLLSNSPSILGLDGTQKMSKSRNNAIYLKSTKDETAELIKKAKTDSIRDIYYDPKNRPEVANLLQLISLATNENPDYIAEKIGNRGSAVLKQKLTEALNEYLEPIRKRRAEIQDDQEYIQHVLQIGVQKARAEAEKTLEDVRRAMNMIYEMPCFLNNINI